MFTSIRTNSALFLGLLSLSVISVRADVQSDQTYRIERQLFCRNNDPYNPFVLSSTELQKKLKNQTETQKIIELLLADPGEYIFPRDIDIFFEEIPDTAKTITLKFDDDNHTITKEQFLANRHLLFSNQNVIHALLDYKIKIRNYPGVLHSLWMESCLITEPEFRLHMTDCFLNDLTNYLNYLSDDTDKEIYFFKRNDNSFIEFISELNKQNDISCLNKITDFVEKHITIIPLNVFKAIIKNNSSATTRLLAACSTLFKPKITHLQSTKQGFISSFSETLINSQPDLKLRWAKKQLARQGLVNFANLTQTEAHFWVNNSHIFFAQDFLKDKPDLVQLLDTVLNHERTLISQGKYVFYHGQRWHLYFLEDLYTKLWELKYKIPVKNYLFTRFMPHIANMQELQNELDQQTKNRLHILSQGRNESNRLDLLFVNYSLFANITNPGSFTLGFFTTDTNIRSTNDLNIQTVFHALDLNKLYTKYELQLKELEESFNQTSKQMNSFCRYGNLLQISISPDAIKKCLYVAQPGGYKRTVHIEGTGETDDVTLIIDTLKTAPYKIKRSDRIEFCLILTRDCALQPNNGIEIYSFNPVALDAWKAYETKRDALLQKIAQEIC